jgi:perosamine synthetase
VKPGSEVILPSETFVATANAVLHNGGTPVFAEIQPETMNLDPDDIESRITERTTCIIPVHIAGLPCDMKALMDIAESHDLTVVEDCAHAHGSMYDNQYCGTFGSYASFSFYPTKVLGGAEGGLLIVPDDESEQTARSLINQGRSGFGPSEITNIGFNYRMNELQASVILPQIPHLDEIVERRNQMANIYTNRLKGVSDIYCLHKPENCRHSYYSYMVKVKAEQRSRIIEMLQKRGIGTSVMYNPVHLQPAYVNLFGYEKGSYPVTETACASILSLPMHNGLTSEDTSRVIENLLSIIED